MQGDTVWLVTGGGGYIGSHVTKELLDFGHKVVVLDDLSTGRKEFIDARASFVEGSILKEQDIQKAVSEAWGVGSDLAIMHIAGVKLPGESMQNPEKYWEVNVLGSFKVGQAALTSGAKALVFSSSCSIYGDAQGLPVDETGLPDPRSPYAQSKLAAEMMFRDLNMAHGIPVAVLRYFNVVGSKHEPIVDLSRANLFPAIVQAVSESVPFVIHGDDYDTRDGSCIRDYMHIGDLAEAHLLAANWILGKKATFEIFNFGTGSGTTVLEILNEFERQLSKKISVRVGPRRDGDPASITANSEKAMKILGWDMQFELADMIKSSLRGIAG